MRVGAATGGLKWPNRQNKFCRLLLQAFTVYLGLCGEKLHFFKTRFLKSSCANPSVQTPGKIYFLCWLSVDVGWGLEKVSLRLEGRFYLLRNYSRLEEGADRFVTIHCSRSHRIHWNTNLRPEYNMIRLKAEVFGPVTFLKHGGFQCWRLKS